MVYYRPHLNYVWGAIILIFTILSSITTSAHFENTKLVANLTLGIGGYGIGMILGIIAGIWALVWKPAIEPQT